MRVYVSGPMTGYLNGNRDAFDQAALWLRMKGHEPILPYLIKPIQHEGECPRGPRVDGDPHTAPCYLRGDVKAVVDSDAILLLDGWRDSAGARLELMVAAQCALLIYVAQYEFLEYRMVLSGMSRIA